MWAPPRAALIATLTFCGLALAYSTKLFMSVNGACLLLTRINAPPTIWLTGMRSVFRLKFAVPVAAAEWMPLLVTSSV